MEAVPRGQCLLDACGAGIMPCGISFSHRGHIAAYGRNQNYKLQNTNHKQITINKKTKKQTKN
jgi:hypothetical protein